MSFLTNFLLGLGLAMDAFAVSMSSGTTVRPFRVSDALKLAVFFGSFQALMPVLGWIGGKWFCFGLRSLDCIRASGFYRV
jgi:putative Mn2+ efflux pump MntP